MLISIIIPVYNVERFLKKCIESVLSQTYMDWELILVDDGSKDASPAICDEYARKDRRIKVIHKRNGGVSSARNTGLKAATGKFVCFVDSDDWIEPSYLEDFKFDAYQADMYVSGAIYDTYGHTFSLRQYNAVYCGNLSAVAECYIGQKQIDDGYPWGKLFKKGLISDNGLIFNEQLSFNEDHIFVLEYMLHVSTMSVTNSCGYHYTVFDNSGRKLSDKVNRFSEHKLASSIFARVIDEMAERWHIDTSVVGKWKMAFVFSKRLQGIRSMVLLDDMQEFEAECGFWKMCPYLPCDRKSRIILAVLKSPLPTRLKECILLAFYSAVRLFHQNSERQVYKDLRSRSTVLVSS